MSERPSDEMIRDVLADAVEQGLVAATVQYKSGLPSEAITIDYAKIVAPLAAKLAPLVRDYRKDAEAYIRQERLNGTIEGVGVRNFAAHLAATADQTERTP